jgi:hypothetical protein
VTIDAHLNLTAARKVQESCLCRLEGAFYNGSLHEIEMAISAYRSAGEAMEDRMREHVFACLRRDGIDPITRRAFRK